MAYAESTIGGTYGGSFRVWVNSIRVTDTGPDQNYEQWRCEGGINRVSTSGGTIYSNGASYNVQLGMNGMATSGGFTYNYNTALGTRSAWGTGTTTVYRDGAGNGFGFTSRTDVNLNNGPYLTSGWVQSSDGVQTKPRHASLTAISMDVGGITFTDETQSWVEFNNPAGGQVDAFIDIIGYGRLQTDTYVGSRHYMQYDSARMQQIEQASPNSNSYNLNIGIIDHIGGGDTYDYRVRTGYIENGAGQANPVFGNFTYADTNTTTTGITGDNQTLIQGKSNLTVTVPVASKATPRKYATMSVYNYAIGGYTQNGGWSNTTDVTQNIGIISDVTGTKDLAVRAIDSRGNSATITKSVNILPYTSPTFVPTLKVAYANNFDTADGIEVTSSGGAIANISPLTIGSTDKNSIVTNGIKFDISKGDNGSYTGTPVNVAWTQASGTGAISVTPSTLASSILTKMNGMLPDNTTRWYIKFQITDKLETNYYETFIDVGRPIFRIGADNNVYNNEIQLLTIPVVSKLSDSAPGVSSSGTGTITPWSSTLQSLYVQYGTGTGNSSTVVFNIGFSCYGTTGAQYAWALKIDGNAIGNSSRKFFFNSGGQHWGVSGTVVATGLTSGTHTVSLELYGQGNTINANSDDYLSIVSTEYANAYVGSSQGANYATVVVDGGGGGNTWTTPSNAQGSQNGSTAYVVEGPGGGGGSANQLKSSGFAFSIPAGATINGILLEANVFGYSGASDSTIQIGRTGKMSTSTPNFGQSWYGTGAQGWLSWGGPSSLWGRADWSASDINNSSFGASISAFASHATSTDTVDAVRITVYYI